MQLKNLKPITFSFVVSLGIAFVFLISTFLIFAYSGADALKDALSTTGSYFGAVATLGAAIIAAHLFNDWRTQQRHINSSEFARIVLSSYKEFDRHFDDLQDCLLEQLELLKIVEEEQDDEINELITIDELLDMGYKLLTLFYFFHDDFVNFCYVSQIQIKANDILEKWGSDVHYFYDKLSGLDPENSNQELIKIIEELTSDALTTLVVDFNIELNQIVLRPLRLED